MAGEIIVGATILAASGSSTWFADKIFGPSVEAVGENLRVFLQSRLPVIFGVAEIKAQSKGLELEPVAPGLLARMIVDASFSEDTPEITDWWASLFISAATAKSNKHAIFSDIMAMIGPVEAKFLDHMLSVGWERVLLEIDAQGRRHLSSSVETLLNHNITETIGPLPLALKYPVAWHQNNGALQLTWPCWAAWWTLPREREDGEVTSSSAGSAIACEDPLVVNCLERVGIFERRQINLVSNGHSGSVTVFCMTPLGLEFYRAVKGYDNV